MKLSVILKQFATIVMLASIIFLSACGSSPSTATPTSVTGNWSVTLFDSNNATAYAFTTTLNQQIASPTTTSAITGTALNLTATDPAKACFNASSTAQQTGLFTVNGVFNGLTTNTVALTINGAPGTINLLPAPFTTNAISGPWTLTNTTGTGCVVSGTFLMTRV